MERVIVVVAGFVSLTALGLGFLWFLVQLDRGSAGCAASCRERGMLGWNEVEGCVCERP